MNCSFAGQEQHANKQYYTIGEVARLFDVSTSLIRYWEKHFEQLNPRKTKQGIRKYSQADVSRLKIIYQLIKEQGYTIRGAMKALKDNTRKGKNHTELIDGLKSLRDFLTRIQVYYRHSLNQEAKNTRL